MSSPISGSPAGSTSGSTWPSSAASPSPMAPAQQEFEQISSELAQLMQRTARAAQSTLSQMSQKATGSSSDVLEAVALLSRLQEQCREALAAAQLSLPSPEQEAQTVQGMLQGLQQADSEQQLSAVLAQLTSHEHSLASSAGHALRTLAQARLDFLRHAQCVQPADGQELMSQASHMQTQHRSAALAIRTLSRMPSLSGAVERVGLAGVAQVIDGDITQAMRICQQHLDQIASNEAALVAGVASHYEQLQRARQSLDHYGHQLERAQAVQMGAQSALLHRAGTAMETLTKLGLGALEQMQQDALRTQATLERLALQPLEAACRTASGLKGAYGAIRAALMGLSEREALVHTLENWLLQEGSSSTPRLFPDALSAERWEVWSRHLHTVSLQDEPQWMAWTFQALGLPHPEVPESLGRLELVVEAYCTARELLQEMEPDYDPEGKIAGQIQARLQRERARWEAWSQLGLATDCPADWAALQRLGAAAIPSAGLQQALERDAIRESSQAQAVAERLQRLILGDWRRTWTLHPKGTLMAYVDDQIAILKVEEELRRWEEIYSQTGGTRKNGWSDYYTAMLQISRTRQKLCAETRRNAPAQLAGLQGWLEDHGRSLEQTIRDRALDLTKLAAPVIEIPLRNQIPAGEMRVALRMPQAMEEYFLQIFGPETIALIRRAEILGLGRLKISPRSPCDTHVMVWSKGEQICSKTHLEESFRGLSQLEVHWIDLSGREHLIGGSRWHGGVYHRQGPLHRPSVFRTQDEEQFWAHPSERMRIVQAGLDGLRPVVADGDDWYLNNGDGSYNNHWLRWPFDSDDMRERHHRHQRAALARIEAILGVGASALTQRLEDSRPKEWQAEAFQAQVRMLAYLEHLSQAEEGADAASPVAGSELSGAASDAEGTHSSQPTMAGAIMEAVTRQQGASHPERTEVWRQMLTQAGFCLVGAAKVAAHGRGIPRGIPGAPPSQSRPWVLKSLPRFESKIVDLHLSQLEQDLEKGVDRS
jgi:hypothetical protein